jgi:hypothetical protein
MRGYTRPTQPARPNLPHGGRLFPRRFALVRHIDYTGISGIGVVAYGVVFSDGHVALRWCSDHPATSLWNSIDDVLAVHGHGDATSVQWIDDTSDRLQEAAETLGAGHRRRARRASREDAASFDTRPVDVESESADTSGQTADVDDQPDEPPPPPPPAGNPPDAWAGAPHRDAYTVVADQDRHDAVATDPVVPSQRRSGGKHRRRSEPSEESAGHR